MLEDTWLKLRFNRGEKDALCRIYEKYKDSLLRLAAGLLGDVSLAEDAVNDAFVTFAQSIGRISLTGSLRSFLTTCIMNRARTVYRARQRRLAVGLDEAGQIPSNSRGPEQSAILKEQFYQLKNAMAKLPYEQQEIIVLRLQNNMRFRQIAQLLDVSINTVKSRYRYGLNKLRSLLDCEVI